MTKEQLERFYEGFIKAQYMESEMKYSNEVIKDWIERCINEGRNLTAWEKSFIESIQDQFDRKRFLSERQLEILERIYTEKVP